MINSSLKALPNGAVTLFTAILLLLVSSLIIIFAASYGTLQDRTSGNINRNQQAFQAAEAGLEFGINYFQQNATTIIGVPVGGYISGYSDSNTTNVTLANGSRYSIVYSNPTANNYDLIKITSTGTSADGTATRVISQLVQKGSLLLNPGTKSLVTKGNVTMSGNSVISNPTNPNTIASAGTVTLGGSSVTTSSTATSTPGNINSDIQQSDATLSNTSQSDFIAEYFGNSSLSSLQSKVEHSYTNSVNTNYSTTLNGMSGTTIFINQTSGTATINGNTVIGTAANPVLMVVNGGLSLSGNITFYGFIFIIGTSGITTTTGNINIIGGIASVDDISMGGNSNLTFNQTVLSNLQNSNSLKYYAKVPGSWKDF